MTEGTKTGSLAAVAGIVVLLAWTTSSRNSAAPDKINLGKPLFEKFADPLSAASLKILRYDTPKEDYVDFELARDRKVGLWTIPSHESYPADAAKQMSEAANLFVGLKALDIASEKKAEHAMFGVIEPNKQNSDKGGEGVGMLVQMRDEKGDILTDLIIGKEIDKKKRFARVPSEDVVYVIELDISPLSTDFKQWIESDLLKLSSNDIETLGVRDYQLVQTTQGLALDRNYEADLAYSTANGQWSASRIMNFDSETPSEVALTAEEQLNATKLNEIKSTLDNLRIADVVKKPAGLAADLKGDKSLLSNQESLMSLQRRGFFPNPNQKGGDTVDFYSKSGELIVTLKDGVQYLLRFGGAAGAEITAAEPTENAEGKVEETVSINRFMLVTTRIDESKFPQPDLERLPETIEELKEIERLKNKPAELAPAAAEFSPPADEAGSLEPKPDVPATEKPATEKPTTENPATEKPTTENPTEEKPVEEKPAAAIPDVPSASLTRSRGKPVAFQVPQEPDVPKPDVAKPEATPQNSDTKPASERTDVEWKEELEAARDRINKANQRKIDDRNDRMNTARKKVAELNGRFADWYYVVSEVDYKKLKVTMPELIQPKSSGNAGGAGSGAGGFPGGGGGFPGGFPGQP